MQDGSSTLDLFGKTFVLLRFGDDAPAADSLLSEAERRRLPLSVASIADAQVGAAYERKLVLVRPDGHVAWRGDELPSDCSMLIATISGGTPHTAFETMPAQVSAAS